MAEILREACVSAQRRYLKAKKEGRQDVQPGPKIKEAAEYIAADSSITLTPLDERIMQQGPERPEDRRVHLAHVADQVDVPGGGREITGSNGVPLPLGPA